MAWLACEAHQKDACRRSVGEAEAARTSVAADNPEAVEDTDRAGDAVVAAVRGHHLAGVVDRRPRKAGCLEANSGRDKRCGRERKPEPERVRE